MISIDDIKEKRFEKAVFGGYDARSVDEFMDEIVSEMAILQKEKSAMQQKLKMEVSKNQEFHALENSMRNALMSAQEISTEMLSKAEQEREQILSEVRESAQEQINTYRNQINQEKQKLAACKKNLTDFIAKMSSFYETKTKELSELSQEVSFAMPATINDETSGFEIDGYEDLLKTPSSVLGYGNKYESMTENILEKVKKETFNPNILDNKYAQNVSKQDTLTRSSSNIQVTELKFGSNYDD